MENKEIAEKLAENFDGNIWENYGKIRVYIGNRGYAEITDKGVDINAIKSAQFEDVKSFCADNNINAYR